MNKNTKQNTLEVIKMLREHLPIERSRMKLRVSFAGKEGGGRLKENVIKLANKVEHEEWDDAALLLTLLIDPGQYRVIDEVVRNETKGKGLLKLLELKEVVESDDLF